MNAAQSTNPYLSGNFAPVRSEDDFELEVVGDMPRELRGALFRIGPNPQFEPREVDHHWFAGDGMVHGFYVEEGRVRYRNRYVRTPKWKAENRAGRALFGAFGNPMTTDPSAIGQDAGVANTHIVYHAGKLMALEEGHMPTEMDAVTLDTRGYVEDYVGRTTAHPKYDASTGELVWFGYGVGDVPFSRGVSYGVTGADGRVKRRDTFEAPYSSMMHDFMVTENYVAFPILPLTASLDRVMSGKPAFAWEPDKGAYIGVMRRDGDVADIRWFNTEACYVFHPMNAWEQDGKLIADVMRYDSAPLFPNPGGSAGRASAARLVRWTMDLAGDSDAINEETLDDMDAEFPRIDPRVETRRHRHGWFAADPTFSKTIRASALAHFNFDTGRREMYTFEGGDLVSEPVFVPRSSDAPEGDGFLTAVVWRAAENRSDLAVFEAQDVGKGPVALAKAPRRVPSGFHGSWAELLV